MSVVDFFRRCLNINYESLLRSVDDLSTEELAWQPRPDCNSIGFLVWHYARVLDFWFQTGIRHVPQLWEEGWAERFGRAPARRGDIGFSFTAAQLQAFHLPDVSELLGYAEASRDTVLGHLKGVEDTDPDTVQVTRGRDVTLPLSTLFEQLVWELNQHGGQIAYLRGMQRGLVDRSYTGPVLMAAAGAG